MNIFDKFLHSVSYKFPKGYPDMSNPTDISLLESLIKNNELKRFSDIQIQFHTFIDNAEERRSIIRKALSEDFTLEYDFEFVWEGWKQK